MLDVKLYKTPAMIMLINSISIIISVAGVLYSFMQIANVWRSHVIEMYILYGRYLFLII